MTDSHPITLVQLHHRGSAALAPVFLLSLMGVTASEGAIAREQPRPIPAPTSRKDPGGAVSMQTTFLQWLRKAIGINPRRAVGGSRNGDGRESITGLCLITPRWMATAPETASAVIALPRPTFVAAGPLSEILLQLNDTQILWRKRARSKESIEGPIYWPADAPPLKPGETVELLLRPFGADGGTFARFKLIAAPASEQQRVQQLLADDHNRINLIEQQARQGQSSLASELVFAPLEKPSKEIDDLRRLLIEQGCKGG
jgi:hypothetical protein